MVSSQPGEVQRRHSNVWVAQCHPSGFVSHGCGHLGVSGITAWPWALGALPDCLSQLDLGAHPGMLSAGREAGMCQGGWGCSSPVRIGCSGVTVCSPPAPKTAQLEAAFSGCFPASVPNRLGLFLLGLDLKRAVKIRKNATNTFSAVSNRELNPKIGSEQGCAALSSAGNQEHPLERQRGAAHPRASWDEGSEIWAAWLRRGAGAAPSRSGGDARPLGTRWLPR